MSGILNALVGSFAPANGSFESITTVSLFVSNSSITFSSIPSTYKSLQIRIRSKDTVASASAVNGTINLNNDATLANYASHWLTGNGSTVSAGAATSNANILGMSMGTDATITNMFAITIIDLIDYGSTSKTKTIRYFSGADANIANTNFGLNIGSVLWNNTSAVSSITLKATTAFVTNSIFALYGIRG